MLVSEAFLLPLSIMRVRISCMDGRYFTADLSPSMTVDEAKIKVTVLTFTPHSSRSPEPEIMKVSLYHKLILVRNMHSLVEENTLKDEGVRDNDELLLLKRRLPQPSFESSQQKEVSRRAPSAEEINQVTSTMQRSQIDVQAESAPVNVDFQTELRKILIALLETSQKLLCLDKDAENIFKLADDILKDPSTLSSNTTTVDPGAIRQLMDMGFSESKASKALLANNMSMTSAMEWLLLHNEDDDQTTDDKDVNPDPSTNKQDTVELEGAVGGATSQTKADDKNTPKIVLRNFRKKEFKPSSKALQNLIEMGFDENDSTYALRVSGNTESTACEWLLGDRERKAIDENDEILDPEGPVFRAIMANPNVQLSLSNPRCFLALVELLERPYSSGHWLTDPEVGALLRLISRIYHTEKNSTGPSDVS